MTRLYISAAHPRQWIAQVPGSGWVAFPMVENGWETRRPARGLDPVHLREVPVKLAANSGLPEFEMPMDLPKVA